jgi:hypothetical protein
LKGKEMKNIKIISFVLVTLIMVGCKDNSVLPEPVEPEPITYDPLIPLGVGNYWLYQAYYLKSDDGSIKFPEANKFGFIIDDTLSQVINGKRILNYKLFNCGEELKPYYDKPGSFEGSKLVYHDKSGIYYSGIEKYDTLKMSFNDLIFPYPAKKNESVSGHVFYYSTLGNALNVSDEVITQYTCVSTDSIYTTPLGDFRCVVYKMVYADFDPLFRDEVYYFIKPGLGIVGMVEMVYHYSLKTHSYFKRTVLTNYKIK